MTRACRRSCGGSRLTLHTLRGLIASSPKNATPEAVACLLEVIRAQGARVGLKVSGGVATMEDVACYVALAAQACGAAWLSPRHLRFGAWRLLPVLLAVLDGAPTSDRCRPAR